MQKKGFTLLEILFSITVFWIIFWVLFSLFIRIINTKSNIEARQTLIQTTYDLVEQLNVKIQNFTIDYEEYFNRSMVWCLSNTVQWSWFSRSMTWSLLWYCPMRTAYGNQSPYFSAYGNHVASHTQHKLYVCSSDAWLTDWQLYGMSWGAYPEERLLMPHDIWDRGCNDLLYNEYISEPPFATHGFRQPFGEYKTQFLDTKGDVDDVFWRSWDDDDTNNWLWPVAVYDNTNVKELYVISHDKRKRIFFRRALVATGDWNRNGTVDTDNEKLYAIQMLQLKAFDWWQNHDFDAITYRWVYDGVTDTRACDYEAWFVCNGASIGGIYSWYNLPANQNDGWVNLTNSDVSVADWNMQIYPIKDPELARWEASYQTNPYIRFYIKTVVYWEDWIGKIWPENIDDVTFDVQTSFNIKTHY